MVDFQKIALGEKIRQIYEFARESHEDEEDLNALTSCDMAEFDYVFDDLAIA